MHLFRDILVYEAKNKALEGILELCFLLNIYKNIETLSNKI